MTIFYSVCAVLGCTVLACQFVLTVTGLSGTDDLESGHDVGHDLDHAGDEAPGDVHDHHTNRFFGVVSFRTVTAASAFFGLTGLALHSSGVAPWPTLAAAAGAGVAAMYFVHWMMRSMSLLRAEGTTRVREAIGVQGVVYVRIPARNSGSGKVHLTLQGRTVELTAATDGDSLPTGTRIVVTRVVGDDAVLVAADPATPVTAHEAQPAVR